MASSTVLVMDVYSIRQKCQNPAKTFVRTIKKATENSLSSLDKCDSKQICQTKTKTTNTYSARTSERYQDSFDSRAGLVAGCDNKLDNMFELLRDDVPDEEGVNIK